MPKKYVIRSFNPGKQNHKRINPLINLSSLGINTSSSILKTSLSLGASETNEGGMEDLYQPFGDEVYGSRFNRYRDITRNQSSSYAFFDMGYAARREFLRQFAQSNEINFILDTITNEAIVNDENGYFAQLDLDRLKLNLNKNYSNKSKNVNADSLIRDCKIAYNTIYSCFGWDRNNDGWNYFKKFLIDGYLAFEIIFDDNENPTTIECFKEVDPVTLEPEIHYYNGKEMQVWYQYRGDAQREHIIPDSNLIYISWTSMNFAKSSRVSYLEGLTRSYNMLRQLENSHLIWNIQNSQKRIKITVPVGSMTDAKAQQRVSELIADYNEEVTIDDASGEVVINGEPKFSFSKTYVFAQREGNSANIEEIGGEGYDMNTTESLQYYWRKFILESQVPANRFTLNISGPPSNQLTVDASVTREEYAFARFIQRIQSVYKEILLKPLWVQICLKHPELAHVDYLRQCLGIKYNEENLFTLAKKRQVVGEGANTVGTLYGIHDGQDKPIFSIDWLVKEFMGLSDSDIEINHKYKEAEILRQIELTKLIKKHTDAANAAAALAQGQNGGGDTGGFGGGDAAGFDAGGFGDDTGGFDTGGDSGGFDTGGDSGGFDTGGDSGGFDTGGDIGGETPAE